MFPFHESLMFFFSTCRKTKQKKEHSAQLTSGVEIAFLIEKLHSLEKACQYFRGERDCHVSASFVLIFEICTAGQTCSWSPLVCIAYLCEII